MKYETPDILFIQLELGESNNVICTSVTDSLIDGGTGLGGGFTEE